MYGRMLNKREVPSIEDMAEYCGDTSDFFLSANQWLSETFGTEQKIVFPYGNKYGWAVAHRKNNKLICNIFAEDNAFTVMLRYTAKQFESLDKHVGSYAQDCIDNNYPCGEGGWINYRVLDVNGFDELRKLLTVKFTK